MVARRSGTNTRQGKRQGQAAKQADPPSWECNAGITKIKAQEGKGKPDVRLCVLDTVDGHAQLGQHGCLHCRLGCGSARPSGCQAFLRLAAFAYEAVLNFFERLDLQRARRASPVPRRAREKWVVVGWQHDDFMGELRRKKDKSIP